MADCQFVVALDPSSTPPKQSGDTFVVKATPPPGPGCTIAASINGNQVPAPGSLDNERDGLEVIQVGGGQVTFRATKANPRASVGIIMRCPACGPTTNQIAIGNQTDGFPPQFQGEGSGNPWNSPECVGYNNCYDYAVNQRGFRDTWRPAKWHKSQPGKHAGQQLTPPVTCAGESAAAQADNPGRFTLSTKDAKCAEGCWKVALMVRADGSDYHWLRQDADGEWSHKRGSTPATRHDDTGADIKDPDTARIDGYRSCHLYFCVCQGCIVAMAAPPTDGAEGTMVAVLIYSGREDPTWALGSGEIARLAAKLTDLPVTSLRPVYTSGYNGFRIVGNPGDGLPEITTVFRGLISVWSDGREEAWYEDVNHVEQWLLTLVGEQPFANEVREALEQTSPLPLSRHVESTSLPIGVPQVVNSAGVRSRFAADRFLGSLVQAGVPLPTATALTSSVVNQLVAEREVTTATLRRLSDLAKEDTFPARVAQILRSGSE